MQPKLSSKYPLFTVNIVGILFCSIIIFSITGVRIANKLIINDKPVESILNFIQDTAFVEQTTTKLPTRLKIPKINIDAPLKPLGITPEGAMDIPKGPKDLSWFEPGTVPGEKGSAVIAGHYGWINGIPAAFDDLHNLQKGDATYIEYDRGNPTIFIVREIKIYDKDESVSNVFYSKDGKSHLNLITCEGVWDKLNQNYSGRLVVFTDKQ